MGYTHGTKWSEELIERELKKVMSMLDIKRMPSNRELTKIGRYDLSNGISRSHGFYGWANKLGLKIKDSETKMGRYYETVFDEKMANEYGYETEEMTVRFPYDRLVEGLVKVDIKSGFKVKTKDSYYYTFNLETANRKSDILVCYCISEQKEIAKAYIIPSIVMQGKKQLSVGIAKSKYDKFIDRYDLISEYLKFYRAKLKELAI